MVICLFMRLRKFILLFNIVLVSALVSITDSGCANIGMPTGGPRDSLPPQIVETRPGENAVNVTTDRITLVFDEFVDVQNALSNIIVSPLQNKSPIVRSNLRTVTIKLQDTLQSNTTYIINFGDAIKDVNEGNVFKNYNYSFSTGPYIDSLTFSGNVILAETGQVDTTLLVYLYQNAIDTAVLNTKPKYISRLDGKGDFKFTNLPAGNFRVYALKDGDGGKTYNSKAELFGFLPGNNVVIINDTTNPVRIFAYAEDERDRSFGNTQTAATTGGNKKNPLRITTSAAEKQDLLNPLIINFSNPVLPLPLNSIRLTDTNYRTIPNTIPLLDSTHTNATINAVWQPDTDYRLVINNENFKDSLGNNLFKSDTISFTTKSNEDYGKLLLRFTNLKMAENPVLILSKGLDSPVYYPLTTTTWQNNMLPPGEYSIRILYDENKNGKWDPGNFRENKQPEKVIAIEQKIGVKANWENENDIILEQ